MYIDKYIYEIYVHNLYIIFFCSKGQGIMANMQIFQKIFQPNILYQSKPMKTLKQKSDYCRLDIKRKTEIKTIDNKRISLFF